MRTRQERIFVGDFETTVYEGQTSTEVWASALVEMYTEDVAVLHSIDETFDFLTGLHSHIRLYYHNLKFDGEFWLAYLLRREDLTQCWSPEGFTPTKDMPNNSYKYLISSMGSWYDIVIKYHGYVIEIRDSLKLLPFSVRDIGKSFGTKHKKLDMEYEGYRYAGCTITDEEKQYIANDVLVVKEALEIMYDQGHDALTIGSCCLKEYRKIQGEQDYKQQFIDLSVFEIDPEIFGSPNADAYIRKSYHGGWCYVVRGKEKKVYRETEGFTADVNSLYPSMMHSESGNVYPVGRPVFVNIRKEKEELWFNDWWMHDPNVYYFIRLRTRFKLKPDRLPCIQIKGNLLYNGTQWLETSDIYNPKTGEYTPEYLGADGHIHQAVVELTLTKTDYELIQEQYDLYETELLDGCYFGTVIGLFDRYIDKYKKIKQENKGAIRQMAKLFLNSLYGKTATSKNSSYKTVTLGDDGKAHQTVVIEFKKKPVFIPVGSAITSYARAFTIRSAQANYHGVNERGFIYADTDSIHCDLPVDQVQGIRIHPTDFCAWKIENQWDTAVYARQKTYMEHITHEDQEKLDEPQWLVRCAGMPKRCKDLLVASMTGDIAPLKKLTKDEKTFLSKRRTIDDFRTGLCIPSKLLPTRIDGGVVLMPTTFEMR